MPDLAGLERFARIIEAQGGNPAVVEDPGVLAQAEAVEIADLRLGLIPTIGPFVLDRLLAARGERLRLSLREDVTDRLLPLIAKLERPPVLVGYCLGGTLLGSTMGYLAAKKDKRIASSTASLPESA